MPQYITMANWTDQGIKNIKDSSSRAEAFRQMATQMGCRVEGLFFTMGQYDIAVRLESPDDSTVTTLMPKLGSLGNVRTQTMRAYTEAEFAQMLQKASA